jgi:hypothetical protein
MHLVLLNNRHESSELRGSQVANLLYDVMPISHIRSSSVAEIVELHIGPVVVVILTLFCLLVAEVLIDVLFLFFVHHLIFTELLVNLVLHLVLNVVVDHGLLLGLLRSLMINRSLLIQSCLWHRWLLLLLDRRSLLLYRCLLLLRLIVEVDAVLHVLLKSLACVVGQTKEIKFKLLVLLISLNTIGLLHNRNEALLLLGGQVRHDVLKELLLDCERGISALLRVLLYLIFAFLLVFVLLFVFLLILLFLFARIRFIVFFSFAAILHGL